MTTSSFSCYSSHYDVLVNKDYYYLFLLSCFVRSSYDEDDGDMMCIMMMILIVS